MELSSKQLREMEKRVSSGESIGDVLLTEYPDAEIAILMGHEEDLGPGFRNAYFNHSEAQKEPSRRSNIWGTLYDQESHYVICATVRELAQEEIIDHRTQLRFEEKDEVYTALRRQLLNIGAQWYLGIGSLFDRT